MNGNKASMVAAWVDPDDAPELTDAFFEHADECIGTQVIKLGRSRADAVVDPHDPHPKIHTTK